MANFYLDTNGISELGQSSSPVRVNGTAGDKDRILLLSNAANVTVGPAVEIIDFAGSVADYAFVQAAGGIAVYRGDTLVATLASNPSTSELRFAEGGLTLEQTAEGPFALGGQEVTAEKAAYTGNGMLTGQEHQSQAGTNGPAGKGQDYFLPKDYLPGNIIRSDELSNTYTTEMNGLVSKAQIIDASTEDEDVLNLKYDQINKNGSIVNVETINAMWSGLTDGEFDAKQVSHAGQGGTNIVVSTTRSTARNFVVEDVKGNSVTAGDGVTGVLSVRGIKGGGTIDVNDNGASLELGGSGATLVTATKSFGLKFGAGTEDFTTSRSKVLTIRSDNDITVGGTRDGGGVDENGAHIQAAGSGKILLITALKGAAGSSDDIANMKGFDAIGVSAAAVLATDPLSSFIVSRGQTVFYGDADPSATTETGATFHTDGRDYNVELNLRAAERELGTLDISNPGGGSIVDNPNSNEISRLTIDTYGHDLTITDLRSDGAGFSDKGAMEAGFDTFVLRGANSVTVKDVSQGGVIDAKDLGGRLAVGSSGGPVKVDAASDGNKALAIATGEAGGEAWIGDVGDSLFFYEGGAGRDTIHFKGSISGDGVINTVAATMDLGAGDDSVVFESGSNNQDTIRLEFGEGRDTLEIRKGAGSGDNLFYTGAIRGLDVLKIDDGQKFTVGSEVFDSSGGVIAPVFELQSSGLTINHKSSSTLDLTGITTQSASVAPAVRVVVENHKNSSPAGTVICSSALAETFEVTGTKPDNPADIATIRGFVAGGVDRFAFDDTGKIPGGANNVHGTKGMFTNNDIPSSEDTLKKRLDWLVNQKLVNDGDYALYTDGTDTYVLANGGAGKVNVVRLEGADYTAALLNTSMGFTSDDKPAPPAPPAPQSNFTLSEMYAEDPAAGAMTGRADGGNTFFVDTDLTNALTISGGSGGDILNIVGSVPKDMRLTATLGDGDDEARALGAVGSGSTLSIDTGSGDDTVTLGGTFHENATVTLTGGDDTSATGGSGDTLKGAGADLSALASASVSISGFEKVDATSALTVGLGMFADYGFTLSGDKLAIELKSNETSVDVSAMKGDTGAAMTIDASATSGAMSVTLSAGTDTASGVIKELVKIGKIDGYSGSQDDDHSVIIKNFHATSEDTLDFSKLGITEDVAEVSTTSVTGNWGTDIHTLLTTVTNIKTDNTTANGKVIFALEDGTNTYIVIGTAGTTGHEAEMVSFDYLIQLQGVASAGTLSDIIEGINFA